MYPNLSPYPELPIHAEIDDLSELLGRAKLENSSMISPAGDAMDQDRSGCAFLQAVHGQLAMHAGTVTDEYAEAIFTHRTLFAVNPAGHTTCARGFAGLAACVESAGAVEAAGAFRMEGEALEKWWVKPL